MTIPANANLRNRDGSPITRVSITPVEIDRTPAPLPPNVSPNMGALRLRHDHRHADVRAG